MLTKINAYYRSGRQLQYILHPYRPRTIILNGIFVACHFGWHVARTCRPMIRIRQKKSNQHYCYLGIEIRTVTFNVYLYFPMFIYTHIVKV